MNETVVLPSSTTSALSIALHPLPILNVSEHLTRQKLLKGSNNPFVLGALLGTQNGSEVEIVNTFELAYDEDPTGKILIDTPFLISRSQQYKQVFPSLELIGWYSVAFEPKSLHISLHEQFTSFIANPLLLMLQPTTKATKDAPNLPFKAYEPTIEIRDRKSRSVFIEAPYVIETGEAERIAVDWTARGGEGGSSVLSHLKNQRAAVKMLHDRIQVLVSYVSAVIAGTTSKDHIALRSLSALLASLPATDHPEFREEFDAEHADVQMTAYLASLTKSTHALNDVVDKFIVMTAQRDPMSGSRRRGGHRAIMSGFDWDRR